MAAHSSISQHLPHQTRHPSNVDAFQSPIYFFTNHMTADVAYYTCLYITAYNDDHIYLISGHLPTDVFRQVPLTLKLVSHLYISDGILS
ncbi:hypothetical protein AFLA_009023 [Aspergillus flavus NRRL3357]|nr:hypothetical protein AFLA_009023 [Aspergillus flavus NRRL3357]